MGQTTSRQQIKLQSKQRMPTFGHEMKSLIYQGHKSLALMLSTRLCTKNGDNFGSYAQWICFVDETVRSPWLGALPGAARQPLTFFASPKKVSKERRPQQSSPATRVPKPSDCQPASQTNSLRSNMFAPLNPSDNRSPWQRLMRASQKQLQLQLQQLC